MDNILSQHEFKDNLDTFQLDDHIVYRMAGRNTGQYEFLYSDGAGPCHVMISMDGKNWGYNYQNISKRIFIRGKTVYWSVKGNDNSHLSASLKLHSTIPVSQTRDRMLYEEWVHPIDHLSMGYSLLSNTYNDNQMKLNFQGDIGQTSIAYMGDVLKHFDGCEKLNHTVVESVIKNDDLPNIVRSAVISTLTNQR